MTNIIQVVAGAFQRRVSGTLNARATSFGSIAVGGVELSRQELVAAGAYFFGGNQVIAQGIAPVTAIPTTGISAGLYNANATKSVVLDRFYGPWVGSGTPTAGLTVFMGISTSKPAGTLPVANLSNWASRNALGGGGASGCWWDATATFTAAVTSWIGICSNMQLAAATVGQGGPGYSFDGAVIVPPGYEVGFAILSGTGTSPLYGFSASWVEIDL